jgi:hypothetical protein
MATYTLISSNVLSSSAASVTFSAIPSTYTDLVLRLSARSSANTVASYHLVTYNGSSTSYSDTLLYKDGTNATPQSQRGTGGAWYSYAGVGLPISADQSTANTFSSDEIYIPSYTASQYKPASVFGTQENNSTAQKMAVDASLWSNTAAITSITLTCGDPSYVSGSSFYLYGISNA